MMRPIPRACCTDFRSSRISAWVVTSRAVEGSSAIRSSGSPASAAARATRCRIPPDSWNGYRSAAAGSWIPTSASRRRASSLAAVRPSLGPLRFRSTSSMCFEHRITGFSIVNGSWKIIEIRLPRSRAASRPRRLSTSLPSRRTSPSVTPTPVGRSRIIARAVSVLPLPDSPTIAMVSPRSRSSSTPSTSVRGSAPATYATRRPRTARSCSLAATSAARSAAEREPVVDPVADHRHGRGEQHDRETRGHDAGRVREQERLVLGEHASPLGHTR